MKNKSLFMKVFVCIFPFIAVSLVYIFKNVLINFGSIFPACPSYTYLGIYCPGCGNTRSVQHLLKGDIVGSLRFNPVPLVGMVIIVLGYIEIIAFVFGRNIKIIPRGRKFWSITIIVFALYFIIRNFIYLF